MVLTPVELIAAVFAFGILFNILLILFADDDLLVRFIDRFYPNKIMMSALLIVIISIMGFYLLSELSIAQIFAAAILGMYIYGLVLVQYPDELIAFSKNVVKNKQKAVLPWIIFAVLAFWVLYTLLF